MILLDVKVNRRQRGPGKLKEQKQDGHKAQAPLRCRRDAPDNILGNRRLSPRAIPTKSPPPDQFGQQRRHGHTDHDPAIKCTDQATDQGQQRQRREPHSHGQNEHGESIHRVETGITTITTGDQSPCQATQSPGAQQHPGRRHPHPKPLGQVSPPHALLGRIHRVEQRRRRLSQKIRPEKLAVVGQLGCCPEKQHEKTHQPTQCQHQVRSRRCCRVWPIQRRGPDGL